VSLKIASELIPLYSQPTQVSEVGVSWLREHRDNPTDATKGSYNTADFALAEKPSARNRASRAFFYENSTYYPFGKKLVFARSFQFGIQQALGSTLSTDIPLPERFFGGGGDSLRGFSLNEAGPRDPDTGYPIGGEALLVFQQEVRFPMHLPKIGSKLGGALFYDAGNVFSSISAIALRTAPTAASQLDGDLSYFSHTVGIGCVTQRPWPRSIGPGLPAQPSGILFMHARGHRRVRYRTGAVANAALPVFLQSGIHLLMQGLLQRVSCLLALALILPPVRRRRALRRKKWWTVSSRALKTTSCCRAMSASRPVPATDRRPNTAGRETPGRTD